LIDGKETFNVAASSFCPQRSKTLAAFTCSLVIMSWSEDQLAMSVVHLEKPKPAAAAGVMLVARALLGVSLSRPGSGVANITGAAAG
jgi:hypothetical protein